MKMKQTVIQIKFDTNKYQALKRYAVKKEVSLEQELEDTLVRLYKKLVPVDVREFIEEYEEPVKPKAKKELKEESKIEEIPKITSGDLPNNSNKQVTNEKVL